MGEIKLLWSEAQVEQGELKVPLEGEPGDGWRGHFERTVRLLGGGDWGEVRLGDGAVSVGGVAAGEEAKVHHFLQAVAEQAASAEAADEGEGSETRAEDPERAEGPDREMTERFRAFGDGEREGEREGDG